MENKILPSVRVPTIPAAEGEDGDGVSETPIVDLPPSEKFGFAFPDQSMTDAALPADAQSTSVDMDQSEHETSEAESQASLNSPQLFGRESADHTPTAETPNSNATPVPSPTPPRFSRAFSMPLPSELGYLNHPHRTPAVSTRRDAYFEPASPPVLSEPPNSCLRELSVEVADSVQMVIQTLLQVSPPHLLDPAKEQFSGCSLSVPSPSISAMLTAMKNLNYVSVHMSRFANDAAAQIGLSSGQESKSAVNDDFDVGEMLQSIGDALSGIAAQSGVELVVYHADVGMKHVSVRGDECGISMVLSHVIRQILDTTRPGDTLEIGLSIIPEKERSQNAQVSDDGSRSSSRASSFPEYDGALRCSFDVGHKFGSPDAMNAIENNPHVTAGTLFREKPRFDSILFRRLLQQLGGIIKEDLQPRLFSPGRSCEISVVLESGSPDLLSCPRKLSSEEQALRQPYANMNIQLASEPSLEELLRFVDSLKGKKVALHASAKGSFAHHLTSYLTAWGLDVSHMSMANSEDMSHGISAGTVDESLRRTSPSAQMTDSPVPVEINPVEEQMRQKTESSNASFIIIDDDVEALRNRLLQLQSEASFHLTLRQRPKLAAHHRKSSPQLFRTKGLKQSAALQQAAAHPVIIHFTSLQNFKLVKDLIHVTLSTPNSSTFTPEIIVLPKPAGPRRVLTALRTAVVKPIVDPFFSPTATSPISPNGQGVNPFSPFGSNGSPSQKTGRPPISPRTTSDRSLRSSKDGIELVQRLPPSPLRDSDSLEYFTVAADKLGTTSLLIQSPDGQPAGIFFHPGASSRQRSENCSSVSVVNPPNLIRDAGNLRPPGDRRLSLQRRETMHIEDGDMPPGERPKGLLRHGSGVAILDEAGSAVASESNTPIHSPAQRCAQMPGPPHQEPQVPPPIMRVGETSMGSVEPEHELFAARGTRNVDVDRGAMGSPTSPATVRAGTPKRNTARRKIAEAPPTPGSSRKGKPSSDGNIVPPINVLIVEDNPINQTILSTFMRKKKIKYDVAKNGAEAVAKWKTGGFHLILMDIQMPVMDGIQATKEIRCLERGNSFSSTPPPDGERTPSESTPSESKSTGGQTPFKSSVIIVALTASSLKADRVAALAAGCNDFLTKPVSLLWLNNKIIEWGSIKALQMWADLRPEVVKNLASGQASQAKAVASKLHVPENRRNRSPPSTGPSSRATPAQIEAIRKLSSATRIPLSRSLEPAESDHSDAENRITGVSSVETRTLNTSVGGVDTGSSGSSPHDESRSNLRGPSVPKEVTGNEALLRHINIKDSSDTAHALTERKASGQSLVLGERTIYDNSTSIAELMHEGSKGSAKGGDPAETVEPKDDEGQTADQRSGTSHSSQKDDDSAATGDPSQKHDS